VPRGTLLGQLKDETVDLLRSEKLAQRAGPQREERPLVARQQPRVQQRRLHGEIGRRQIERLLDPAHRVPHRQTRVPQRVDQLLDQGAGQRFGHSLVQHQ
jgi:hypothetical protein